MSPTYLKSSSKRHYRCLFCKPAHSCASCSRSPPAPRQPQEGPHVRFGGRRCPSHAELREPPSCTGGSLSPVSAQRFVHFSSCCYLGAGTDFWQHARPGQQREKLRSRRRGRKRGRGGRRSPEPAGRRPGERPPSPAARPRRLLPFPGRPPAHGSGRSGSCSRGRPAERPSLRPRRGGQAAAAAPGSSRRQTRRVGRRASHGPTSARTVPAPSTAPPVAPPTAPPRLPSGRLRPRYSLATAPRALGWKVAGVLPALSAGRMTETALFIRSLFHSL